MFYADYKFFQRSKVLDVIYAHLIYMVNEVDLNYVLVQFFNHIFKPVLLEQCIHRFQMTSCQPYCKEQPCRCTKPTLQALNSIFMQTSLFLSVKQHGWWSCEGKGSVCSFWLRQSQSTWIRATEKIHRDQLEEFVFWWHQVSFSSFKRVVTMPGIDHFTILWHVTRPLYESEV